MAFDNATSFWLTILGIFLQRVFSPDFIREQLPTSFRYFAPAKVRLLRCTHSYRRQFLQRDYFWSGCPNDSYRKERGTLHEKRNHHQRNSE
ncbi:MAG: hypothetical protein HY960_04290 [Ignavibacteriae bacterium]|nr:hypothetical protein [Ignavibacteriota bacterium]